MGTSVPSRVAVKTPLDFFEDAFVLLASSSSSVFLPLLPFLPLSPSSSSSSSDAFFDFDFFLEEEELSSSFEASSFLEQPLTANAIKITATHDNDVRIQKTSCKHSYEN